jgi:hypothetical protein
VFLRPLLLDHHRVGDLSLNPARKAAMPSPLQFLGEEPHEPATQKLVAPTAKVAREITTQSPAAALT